MHVLEDLFGDVGDVAAGTEEFVHRVGGLDFGVVVSRGGNDEGVVWFDLDAFIFLGVRGKKGDFVIKLRPEAGEEDDDVLIA